MEDETGLIECVARGRLLEKGTPRFSIDAFLEVTGHLRETRGAPTLDLDSLRAPVGGREPASDTNIGIRPVQDSNPLDR